MAGIARLTRARLVVLIQGLCKKGQHEREPLRFAPTPGRVVFDLQRRNQRQLCTRSESGYRGQANPLETND